MLLSFLLACGPAVESDLAPVKDPADPDPTDPGETAPEDPPYVADEDAIEPLLGLDEVGAAVTEAVATAKMVDGSLLFRAYRAALDEASSSCPYMDPLYQELYSVDYWYDSCTADSGTSFNGYGYGYLYEPFWSGTYYYSDYAYFYGDAVVSWADGSEFVASGNASYTNYDESTSNYGVMSLYTFGQFSWDADEAAGTWLAAGVSASLSTYAVDYRGWGARMVVFDGGLSHLDGTTNAVVFDQLYAANQVYGSPCEMEPGGMVSVRDSQGEWYDVVFDGADYGSSSVFPPECDGCGHVWFRGELLGDVCPDLSGLLDWEGWSW